MITGSSMSLLFVMALLVASGLMAALVASGVENSGIIEARTAYEQNGEIVLMGTGEGIVAASGTFKVGASADSAEE